MDLGDVSPKEDLKPKPEKKSKSLFDASKHTIFDDAKNQEQYALAVLDAGCEMIRTAAYGQKHQTRLYRARVVAGFVGGGYLDESLALERLIAAAHDNTDDPKLAEKDIRDGFEHGKKAPIEPLPLEIKNNGPVVKTAKQLLPPTPVEGPTTTDNDDDDWADPEPLVVKTDPKPYPIESLPPIIKNVVLEVVEFVQAPVPIVASAALAAIATIAQGHFDVRRAEGLEGPISLFCLATADSGDRKASAARFSKTIQQHEKNEREQLAPEWKKYQELVDSWESKRRGLKQRLTNQQQKGEENEAKDTEEELVVLQ